MRWGSHGQERGALFSLRALTWGSKGENWPFKGKSSHLQGAELRASWEGGALNPDVYSRNVVEPIQRPRTGAGETE